MSDDSESNVISESNAVLGFVVGAVLVAALAFIVFVVPGQRGDRDIDVRIEAPISAAPANPG